MPDTNSLLQAELAAAASCDSALMRMATTCALAGLRPTHVGALVKRGQFPRPVKLSAKVVRWKAGDVKKWLAEQGTAAA